MRMFIPRDDENAAALTLTLLQRQQFRPPLLSWSVCLSFFRFCGQSSALSSAESVCLLWRCIGMDLQIKDKKYSSPLCICVDFLGCYGLFRIHNSSWLWPKNNVATFTKMFFSLWLPQWLDVHHIQADHQIFTASLTSLRLRLLVPGATLAARRRPVARGYAPQCLTKLSPKPVMSEGAKTMLSNDKKPFFNVKMSSGTDKTAATA